MGTLSDLDEMGPSMGPPFESRPSLEEKKRSRIQLSCTQCRSKKLKCDRGHPCDNCAKRSQSHLCAYQNRAVRAQPRSLNTLGDIQSRIHHLEDLVVSLRTDILSHQQRGVKPTERQLARDDNTAREDSELQTAEEGDALGKYTADTPGRMLVDQISTRWVDASHWQAILDDITELKDCAEALDQAGQDTFLESAAHGNHGPTLLLGVSSFMSSSELLACLPMRPVVDRLISRFFNTKESGLMLLHVPTFYKEYTQFWENQQEVPIVWVGLLFGILCHSVSFYHRAGDTLPGSLGEPADVSGAFRTRAAQCLVLSDYTRPGRYTVETLLIYLGSEFLKSSETQLGVSVLLGITIRLAMHMGYHRDSKHYPTLSVFDGEMRRRSWALISQIDQLVSFQAGLPKIIPSSLCDTELPLNLLDEDLDETTTILPPSRPETERTPVTYTIMKGRLMSVFARIVEKTSLARSVMHEEVTRLDKRLQDTRASLPPFLRFRTMDLSITDPPDLIMERCNIELLYQKARCVLHRRYLTVDRSNLRYSYSRWCCVDAATQILRLQNDIYHETLPGGQLYRDRWFVSSLTSHDFLLAAMILCLDLSYKAKCDLPKPYAESVNYSPQGEDDLLHALEASHRVWQAFSETSLEAFKAFKAVSLMLEKAKAANQSFAGVREQAVGDHRSTSQIVTEYPFEDSQVQMFMPSETDAKEDDTQSAGDHTSKIVSEMSETPEEFNWSAWDSQLQYNNLEMLDGPWIGGSALANPQPSSWSPKN